MHSQIHMQIHTHKKAHGQSNVHLTGLFCNGGSWARMLHDWQRSLIVRNAAPINYQQKTFCIPLAFPSLSRMCRYVNILNLLLLWHKGLHSSQTSYRCACVSFACLIRCDKKSVHMCVIVSVRAFLCMCMYVFVFIRMRFINHCFSLLQMWATVYGFPSISFWWYTFLLALLTMPKHQIVHYKKMIILIFFYICYSLPPQLAISILKNFQWLFSMTPPRGLCCCTRNHDHSCASACMYVWEREIWHC